MSQEKLIAEDVSQENIPGIDPNLDAALQYSEIISDTTLRYTLPEHEGRELVPGHKLIFLIPDEFKDRVVRDVTLKHRKADKYCKDIGADRHDPHGAYSLVELHKTDTEDWVGWKDPKGYSPIKFAEPRSANDPENEVLHDWIATVGKIKTDAVRVTNTGESPQYSVSQIHGLEINFLPELGKVSYEENILCLGTSFPDQEGNGLPKYGGGSHTEGVYKGALVLNKRSEPLYETTSNPPSNTEINANGALEIKLKNGKLSQVEVAVGDTEHLDTISQKTGRKTRLGYAKLWVGVKKADSSSIEWFIQNANVPPQGIISGSPFLQNNDMKEGDTLVIESRADTSYIMGWRLAYKNEESVN